MTFDPSRVAHVAAEVVGDTPHPDAPVFKVRDYETWARVAARLNENPRPTSDQMLHAFHLLTNAGVSPADFERVWDIAKPLANRLLGRAPTIQDLAMLGGALPGDIQRFYLDHPHPEVPEVSAGDIARYHAAATPYARTLIGREPVIEELKRFALAGYEQEDIAAHYADDGTLGGLKLAKGKGDEIPPHGIGPGGVENPPPTEPGPWRGWPPEMFPPGPDPNEKPPPQGPDYIPPHGYGPGGVENPPPKTVGNRRAPGRGNLE